MGPRSTDITPSPSALSLAQPVRVDWNPDRDDHKASSQATGSPKVAALIVTWNRYRAVDAVLHALSRQTFDRSRLHIVVIDNGSSDGTAEHLTKHWTPDRIVDNPTSHADQPEFRIASGATTKSHPDGFGSFSLVRNAHNLGGCGGFNTGLAFAETYLDSSEDPLSYAWLVDDDVDLPANALTQLVTTGERDQTIGLVGSRTVDFDDRKTTIETTIYFDAQRGRMGPEPAPDHRLAASHASWVSEVGGTNGERPFAGAREVDIVSACSMLARWSAVKDVGFWDRRYFIYCDDADWCLRFAARGHRVVCDLDAVVYHTYWLSKLTPTRAYYAARNLFWVNQKSAAPPRLRRVLGRQLAHALLNSYKMAIHCQITHAEIFRRCAHDAVTNRGGKLDVIPSPDRPLLEAFRDAGALGPYKHIAIMCSHDESISWADDVRAKVTHALIDEGRSGLMPRWTYVVRKGIVDAPGVHGIHDGAGPIRRRPARVWFANGTLSKLKLQWWLLRDAPDAVLIIDQSNDAPLLWSRRNILVDRRRPDHAQVERDGWRVRATLACRCITTAIRCVFFIATAKPVQHAGKYE